VIDSRFGSALGKPWLGATAVIGALALVSGCSGESARHDDDSAGGSAGAAAMTGGTGGATGGSAGASGSGNAAGAGGDCNDLVPSTGIIEFRQDDGEEPAALGGELRAGVYDLTSVVLYTDDITCFETYRTSGLRVTLRVEPSSPMNGQLDVLLSLIETTGRAHSSYVIEATELVLTPLCGDGVEDRDGYSATETTLSTFSNTGCGRAAYTLTRR
jgi:hypothetical protein